MMINGCKPDRMLSCSPTAFDSPVSTNACAIAMPPANRIRMPHGTLTAVSQFSNCPPRPFGIRNIASTAINATVASLAPFKSSQRLQPPKGSLRVIHASTVKPKISSMRRSSARHGPAGGIVSSPLKCKCRVNHKPASGVINSTTGTPQLIHCVKLTVIPVKLSYSRMNTRFGGVPIGEPSPPMLLP